MKRGNIVLLLLVIVLGAIAALVVSVLHNGVSARATPNALEVFVARHLRHFAIPSDARAMKNPVADSPEVQREARLHFADHCAICHGNNGSGDTTIGHGLYPKPPDLRQPRTQDLFDGEIYWIIQNGVRLTGMPAFGGSGEHDNEDTWKLVRFIRHLPKLTEEERLEMEKYNPKGPEDREEEKQEEQFLNNGVPAPQPSAAQPHHHH